MRLSLPLQLAILGSVFPAFIRFNSAKADTSGVTYTPSVAADPGFDYGRASFDIPLSTIPWRHYGALAAVVFTITTEAGRVIHEIVRPVASGEECRLARSTKRLWQPDRALQCREMSSGEFYRTWWVGYAVGGSDQYVEKRRSASCPSDSVFVSAGVEMFGPGIHSNVGQQETHNYENWPTATAILAISGEVLERLHPTVHACCLRMSRSSSLLPSSRRPC
jgi:hypothetical protein